MQTLKTFILENKVPFSKRYKTKYKNKYIDDIDGYNQHNWDEFERAPDWRKRVWYEKPY